MGLGNDGTFGNNFTENDLRPIFDAGQKAGLNLWDTAFVYGMGTSEEVLGKFLRSVPRESYLVSTKFTPQCADDKAENAVIEMYKGSVERLGTDFFDYYWIHNPVGAPEWTRKLIPLAKTGKIGKIAEKLGAAVAQLPVAWAIAKGAVPILGVTKVKHVEDAVKAANLNLSESEIKELEALADKANINTVRVWEKEMK